MVFGLLGLAVFINFFAMPRSAPVVGGMVLTLMTLPTIIIASRAALKSVPPSIREAALGMGASPMQTIFHHVLPLALFVQSVERQGRLSRAGKAGEDDQRVFGDAQADVLEVVQSCALDGDCIFHMRLQNGICVVL